MQKDKYVRSVADFLNLQERTKRDMDSARNFAIQRFSMDLLESIDNFDRALLAVPADKLSAAATESNKDLLDLVDGLKMTQNILMNTLQKHGLQRFDPSAPTEEGKTQKFDPNLHEATFMAKAEGKEDGDIMYTQSKGFMLNGRVIRVRSCNLSNHRIRAKFFSLGCQGWRCQEQLNSMTNSPSYSIFDHPLSSNPLYNIPDPPPP